ncbi:MAG TPA: hypothetical protein VM286_05830 [Candidatus Thermoplasmatota archaeon]|nr:hypothetical protein [Candidatus Thermoplasmatota archaeon]
MAGGLLPVAPPDETTLTQATGVLAVKDLGVTPSKAASALKLQPMVGACAYKSVATETIYAPLVGFVPNSTGVSTTEIENRCRMAVAGSFTAATLIASGPLAVGHTIVVTVMKNGVATTMAATIDENSAAGATISFSNLQTFTASDKLSMRIAYTGVGSGANKGFAWSLGRESS